jgi:hypothetical protein
MWHDEAALVLNVIGKGFQDLLGPLLFAEAAPPLFLWLERTVALTLGEGTYALRFPPFVASCAAMVLIVPVARRVLLPAAVPWALLLFACSDHLLWHACEAKPYAFDVLIALGLVALFCDRQPQPLPQQLLRFTLLVPLVIFLTYPGCFLLGGLLLALLPSVWRERQTKAWLSYGFLVFATMACFTLLYLGPVRAQRGETILHCWQNSFPPWHRPWFLPAWCVLQTLEIFRYCCEPVGAALAGLAGVGGALMWQRRRRGLVVLFAVPVVLAFAASCVKAYPYGGTRVLVYAAPGIVLLIAESVPPILAWLQARTRLGTAAFAGFVLLPLPFALYRTVAHWPRADSAGAAAYVLAHRQPAEIVAVNSWECLYYFRHLGSQLTGFEGLAGQSASRLWMVIGDRDPQARWRLAQTYMPADYQPLARRDFSRTTVLLLGRDPAR